MRKEPNFVIFHRAFSSRSEVASALAGALKPAPHDFEHLKKACLELEATISEIGQGEVEDQYRAYHTAIAIFVLLAEWKHAIRNAEPDTQRFLSSAKLKHQRLTSL
jgi:hypothetical protein